MSFNGAGTFVINSAGNPVVTGTTISSTWANDLTADLATGLSTCITKDGQTTPTANIPMGNNKITGLATGTVSTDAINLAQLTQFGVPGYTTTATAAGTTVLTVASTKLQYFTGSTTQTVTLPVTNTLVLGFQFTIVNNSSGVVTVNSSGGNAVVAMVANSQVTVTCILTSGTSAASWGIEYTGKTAVTGTGGFVLSTSPTITTPALSFAGGVLSSYSSATSWTPTDASGATLTFTSVSGGYIRVGDGYWVWAQLTYPSTADGTAAKIGGFPITIANTGYANGATAPVQTSSAITGNLPPTIQAVQNTTTAVMQVATTQASVTNANLSSLRIRFAMFLPIV